MPTRNVSKNTEGDLFAVIELGTTSVRMAIASSGKNGEVLHVENLYQA